MIDARCSVGLQHFTEIMFACLAVIALAFVIGAFIVCKSDSH